MKSKLFAALISLTIITVAACRSSGDGGGAGPTPTQQAATQPTTATPVSNSSSATQSTTPASGATSASNNETADACKLLTSEEIQAVQGEGVKATKGTDASTGAFTVSQCFYETANFANSVSLTLTKRGVNAQRDGPREFWKRNFGGEKTGEREKEKREKASGGSVEEEEEGLPPTPVKGVGDEAFWVGNSKVGALYVLKGDKYVRISLGGGDTQEKKLEKSKALAERALKRI